MGGSGTTGVFGNLAARPEAGIRVPEEGEVEGNEWVPEDAQKEGPPVRFCSFSSLVFGVMTGSDQSITISIG